MIAFPAAGAKSASSAPPLVAVFSSELGWMAAAWRDEALAALVFGHASRQRALEALGELPEEATVIVLPESCTPAQARRELGSPAACHIERLRDFASGRPVDLADIPLWLEGLSPFGRRVVGQCRAIGRGQTLTYGELARRAGSPRAARAVGGVMAGNRLPLVVPCHRVVGSGGSLGGYSAPGGLKTKRRLLALEESA